MLVGSTRPWVVEYCLGTLQAHLQNKCVITKYDYCGWYGCRVATIPLYDRTRVLFIVIYRTPPPPLQHPFYVSSALYAYIRVDITVLALVFAVDISLAECNFTKQYITTFTLYPTPVVPSGLSIYDYMVPRFVFFSL